MNCKSQQHRQLQLCSIFYFLADLVFTSQDVLALSYSSKSFLALERKIKFWKHFVWVKKRTQEKNKSKSNLLKKIDWTDPSRMEENHKYAIHTFIIFEQPRQRQTVSSCRVFISARKHNIIAISIVCCRKWSIRLCLRPSFILVNRPNVDRQPPTPTVTAFSSHSNIELSFFQFVPSRTKGLTFHFPIPAFLLIKGESGKHTERARQPSG